MHRRFTYMNLVVWQEAHQLISDIYKLTSGFPRSYQYNLCEQMTRAVLSISNNLAEGAGRETARERFHFYSISKGSAYELVNLLLAAQNLQLIDQKIYEELENRLSRIAYKIHRLKEAEKNKP